MCHNGAACKGKVWYHLPCAQISKKPRSSDKWMCEECRKHQELIDEAYEHTKLILWLGLGDRVRYKAVRYNRGLAIIRHWKFDLIDFHRGHHWRYFFYAFRLIAAVNGAESERIAHSLIWNR